MSILVLAYSDGTIALSFPPPILCPAWSTEGDTSLEFDWKSSHSIKPFSNSTITAFANGREAFRFQNEEEEEEEEERDIPPHVLPSLGVYELIQLGLNVQNGEMDKDFVPSDSNYHLRLIRDERYPDQFWVLHDLGIHFVSVLNLLSDLSKRIGSQESHSPSFSFPISKSLSNLLSKDIETRVETESEQEGEEVLETKGTTELVDEMISIGKRRSQVFEVVRCARVRG